MSSQTNYKLEEAKRTLEVYGNTFLTTQLLKLTLIPAEIFLYISKDKEIFLQIKLQRLKKLDI